MGEVHYTNDTCQQISILRATQEDLKDIWEWRNDELTKEMSITTDSVSWETHRNWYNKALANSCQYLYLGFTNTNDKIGICRFDLDKTTNIAEVSINLNPKLRGKKLSSQLLSLAIAKFHEEQSACLVATIKKQNIGSIKCFTKSGFIFEREDDKLKYYKKVKNPIKK